MRWVSATSTEDLVTLSKGRLYCPTAQPFFPHQTSVGVDLILVISSSSFFSVSCGNRARLSLRAALTGLLFGQSELSSRVALLVTTVAVERRLSGLPRIEVLPPNKDELPSKVVLLQTANNPPRSLK